MKLRFLLPILLLSVVPLGATVRAQTPEVTAVREWQWDVSVYLWGASLDGETGIGPFVTQVDASFSDILENLELAAMGRAHARYGPWVFGTDIIYVDLAATSDSTPPVDIDVEEWIVELDVGYQLTPQFQSLIGARYVQLGEGLEFTGPLGVTRSRSGTIDWWDPVIGGILTLPIGKSWNFHLRGDIGGFGVGSDDTWQIEVLFNWNISEHTSVLAGWRWLDIEYKEGNFLYDMMMQGPELGVTWRF